MDPPELVPPVPRDALRARREPNETILIVNDLLATAEVTGLCRHLRSILKQQRELPVICDVRDVVVADAATVDALCRLQFTARRCGRAFELRHARHELEEMIAFMGLSETLPSRRN